MNQGLSPPKQPLWASLKLQTPFSHHQDCAGGRELEWDRPLLVTHGGRWCKALPPSLWSWGLRWLLPAPQKARKTLYKTFFFPKGCQVELGQETADRDGQTHSARAAAATPGKNSAKESETHVHIHTRTIVARGRNPIRYFIPRLSLIWLSGLKEHPCVPVNPRLRRG